MYSKTYMEHFAAPKNIGIIGTPSATCTVKNEEGGCFDTVQAYVKIEDNIIIDFKYKLKACSGTITAFSLISTMLIGKTIEEARSITFEQMDELLGGVPEKKSHSLRLAIEARDKIIN
ncbi:MAG: iron-sulfur cluster assembly scaffold protein [Candidatus Delongbacteria bacterium]|jgi:nitrogen fixation NifU-like protein|nr:iron-sulfur cluster assembly scaffold protein [Candidatus Delongbacteria bacterium]